MSGAHNDKLVTPLNSDPDIPEKVRQLLDGSTAGNVRFIKLGRKSMWWPLARDSNTLRLGFRHFDFQLFRDGKWPEAEKAFAAWG